MCVSIIIITMCFRFPRTGAILFQGFAVRDGVEFEEVVQRYNPELCDEYRGTSPRTQVPGTKVNAAEVLTERLPLM